jgi:hypothetical protein
MQDRPTGGSIPDVGAQDPESRNSPVLSPIDDEFDTLRQEVPGDAVCYFNGTAFADGSYVRSGTGVLRCERGIWVPAGGADSDNP